MSLFSDNYSFNHSGDKNALENLVHNYPYFSHAHFLLLKQLKEDESNYQDVVSKTSLHFANPFLLEQQLKQDDAAADIHIIHSVIVDEQNEVEITGSSIITGEADELADEMPPVTEEKIPVNPVNPEVAIDEDIQERPVQKEEPLLFEPLHTTDYFASQGIKLSESVLPNDKMGRQLRSFTEWLKTMKKVHPADLDKKVFDTTPIDQKVQNMAEKSNIEEDVVTESMAEVYLQQGKKQKAMEIYEKLSLLNPAKNAYFAAKLNEIQ